MKKFLIVFCILCVSSNIAKAVQYGGADAGAINSQYMLDMRKFESGLRNKNKSAIVNTSSATESQIANSDIKAIIFINNSAISSGELLNVVQDKINKPMDAENVTAIRKDIMKYYQSKGYYSAVVLIASQNNKDGELILEIQEGTRNSITIQE